MSALLVGPIVFVCLFGATLVGMALSRRLPAHHLDPDSKDVIKLATAVVGTLAALALALLIASAKTTYENANAVAGPGSRRPRMLAGRLQRLSTTLAT
jgi:predicted membrane protein